MLSLIHALYFSLQHTLGLLNLLSSPVIAAVDHLTTLEPTHYSNCRISTNSLVPLVLII
jgi:hypothetical protein